MKLFKKPEPRAQASKAIVLPAEYPIWSPATGISAWTMR